MFCQFEAFLSHLIIFGLYVRNFMKQRLFL